MPKSLNKHADELYDVFEQLMRAYLFRDRSQMSSRTGLTVSQVYALDRLGESEGLTMAELAARCSSSTATWVPCRSPRP